MSDTIEFQLLGATEARRDGEPVPLSGARRRALVARLLLDADRVVRADALIEDVWDGSPRPAATATLQSHISQLRKVLGDRLQSQAAGYVLRTDAVIVDAAEFERQAEAGAAQLSASDAAARTTLRGALALWHGRALQDVAERPWAQPEAARLEELRAVTIEHLLAARLEAGEHDDVVMDAESAVAEAPLREQRWAVLMLALYRSGRQADALRAYRRLRTMLADELGIDPSPPLAQLEAAILQHDPALIPASLAAPAPGPASTQPRLAEARAAAHRREWRTAFDALVDVDAIAPLAADDLELLGDIGFMAGEQEVSIAARERAHAKWLAAGEPARAAIAALLIVGNHYVRNRPAIAAGWFHKGRRLLEDQPEGPAHGVLAFTAALIAMAQGHPAAAADAAVAGADGRASVRERRHRARRADPARMRARPAGADRRRPADARRGAGIGGFRATRPHRDRPDLLLVDPGAPGDRRLRPRRGVDRGGRGVRDRRHPRRLSRPSLPRCCGRWASSSGRRPKRSPRAARSRPSTCSMRGSPTTSWR